MPRKGMDPRHQSGRGGTPAMSWDASGFPKSIRNSPFSERIGSWLSFRISPGVPPFMSYRCEVCGKEPSYGKTVSFSHKRNNRRWLPNIQIVRVRHGSNTRKARVCASCIRAGKVQKA
jgi:large subunit ribosomal protein L28